MAELMDNDCNNLSGEPVLGISQLWEVCFHTVWPPGKSKFKPKHIYKEAHMLHMVRCFVYPTFLLDPPALAFFVGDRRTPMCRHPLFVFLPEKDMVVRDGI